MNLNSYQQAIICKNKNNLALAITYFEKSISEHSFIKESYLDLGNIYSTNESFYNKAIFFYEKYLELDNCNAVVFNILGHLYNRTGNIEKSYEYISKGLLLDPLNKDIISNKLFTLQKLDNISKQNILEIAKKDINTFKNNLNINNFEHIRKKKKEKIHIGYISGDFNQHVIMLYLLPILENHDRDKFIISCYSNTKSEDEDLYTVKTELASDNFINISELSDFEVAQIIFDDEVDILVDLSGHTAKNRTFVTMYKPAPIQVSYLGFPNTTGINEIDYFLTNQNLNTTEEQKFFVEKLYFLNSCYRCFKPDMNAVPEIHYSKNSNDNMIIFGVFNDLSKINESVYETWSEILKRVNNSKLYICRNTLIEDVIYSKFEKYGISKNQMILDKNFSLSKYNNIDIHLDTFPYSGVTVIFDSLIMGVPTLTINGDCFASREATNINKYLSLNEFIANDKYDYVNKAIILSNKKDDLKILKSQLRDRFFNSIFCNYQIFTKELENFYTFAFEKIIS